MSGSDATMSPVNSPVRGTVSPVRGTVVRSPVRGMGTTSVSHSYDNGDNGYDNYSDYIGVQSIIVRLFLLFESLVIFPTVSEQSLHQSLHQLIVQLVICVCVCVCARTLTSNTF